MSLQVEQTPPLKSLSAYAFLSYEGSGGILSSGHVVLFSFHFISLFMASATESPQDCAAQKAKGGKEVDN